MRSNPLVPFSNTLPVSSTDTLNGFIEIICKHAFIVRVGPEATENGKPWEASCMGHVIRWWQFWYWKFKKNWFCTSYVIFKGFAGKELLKGTGTTMGEVVTLAVVTTNRMYSLPVRWKRLGNSPGWLFQVSGVSDPTGRTIKMDKQALHEKHGSRNHEGHLKNDKDTVVSIAEKYIEKLKSGEHKIVGAPAEISLGNGLFVRTFVIQE